MKELAFVIVAVYVAVCMWLDVRDRLQAPPAPPQRNDLNGILPHVERAARIAQQLKELEDLQTSLDLCAPREYAQAVRMEWVNRNGNSHRVTMWADGTQSTAQMKAAAAYEKEFLTRSLLSEISLAYCGTSETITETAATDRARFYIETGTETGADREEAAEDA